jgi:hypothetical protein
VDRRSDPIRTGMGSPKRLPTDVCAGQPGCGAPRRNRTGDPILTMEPPGTAVRTALSPGRARPSGPKLWVLPRRRDALTFGSRSSRERQQSRRAHRTASLSFHDRPSFLRMLSVRGAERVIDPQAHRGLGRPEDGRAVYLEVSGRDPSFRPHAGEGHGPWGAEAGPGSPCRSPSDPAMSRCPPGQTEGD